MLQWIAPEISFGWRSGMPLWQWHGDGRLAREVSHKITWGIRGNAVRSDCLRGRL